MLRRIPATIVIAAVAGITSSASAGLPTLDPFAAYGTVQQGIECPIFQATDGSIFHLVTNEPPPPGSFGFVTGLLDPECVSFCFLPCIENPTFTPGFQSFGTIVQAIECLGFLTEDGQFFQIAPQPGFAVGDFVQVAATIDGGCQSFCFAPCLENVVIRPAIKSFGTLVQAIECLAFQAEGGPIFFIEPQPGFGPGDFVHVTAAVDPDCNTFCFLPCLDDVAIEPAFTGCGELLQGFECLIFSPDSGGSFHITGDFGGFGHGDRVDVTGIVDDDCPSFCFLSCLVVGDIASATADLDCNGEVAVNDLLLLLAQWGPCTSPIVCLADLNNDNVVNVQDLLILLALWG